MTSTRPPQVVAGAGQGARVLARGHEMLVAPAGEDRSEHATRKNAATATRRLAGSHGKTP